MDATLGQGLQVFGQRNLVEANVSINEESGCDKKVGEVPEEMTLAKNFTPKELWDISRHSQYKV